MVIGAPVGADEVTRFILEDKYAEACTLVEMYNDEDYNTNPHVNGVTYATALYCLPDAFIKGVVKRIIKQRKENE